MDSITNSMDMNLSKLQEMVRDRDTWRATVHGITKSQPWLSEEALQIAEKRRDLKAKEKKKCIPI